MVNEAIRCKEMLVITDKGEKLGVLSRSKALIEAENRGLDLVLVSSDANPPVAKMMDYSRCPLRRWSGKSSGRRISNWG